MLYGHPLDMNDPEDVLDLLVVAFGIKSGEVFQSGLTKLAPEEAEASADASTDQPLLALQVAYIVLRADRTITQEESRFLQIFSDLLEDRGLPPSDLDRFRNRLDPEVHDVLEALGQAPAEHRPALFEIATRAAAVDGSIHRREDRLLPRIAQICEVTYDKQAVLRMAKR